MSEQDHIIETFTEMASRYEGLMNSELNRFWGVSYLEFMRELIDKIDFDSRPNILDIATGTALIPQYLLSGKISKKMVVGLDLTFEMLINAKEQIGKKSNDPSIQLVRASAHAMPFQKDTFDIAICCLATHHMNADLLLNNIHSSLKLNGKLHIADAGSSKRWKIGIIRFLIKVFAFIYFLIVENFSRAQAEKDGVGNIRTVKEWRELIASKGFVTIKTEELKSKRFWTPNPVIIEAKKQMEA